MLDILHDKRNATKDGKLRVELQVRREEKGVAAFGLFYGGLFSGGLFSVGLFCECVSLVSKLFLSSSRYFV